MAYQKSKPHLNIGTLGDTCHGKTTLISAITKVLAAEGKAEFKTVEEIEYTYEEYGMVTNISSVEYETENRHYAHIDYSHNTDYAKNMITGTTKFDAAILVVSAIDGPTKKTKEHLLLAKQIYVPYIIVYINKLDQFDNEILLELVTLKIINLLNECGYPGYNIPIIQGSALEALEGRRGGKESVLELLYILDTYIPEPKREIDKPFLMPIEDVFSISNRGTVVTGRIERGKIKKRDAVEIIGFGKKIKTNITGIEMFRKMINNSEAGDNVGLLLDGVQKKNITRGMVVTEPNSIKSYYKFEALIYILTASEGGMYTPFFNRFKSQFYFRTVDINGEIILPQGIEKVMPGDSILVTIELIDQIALENGLRFAIRLNGRTIGSGIITKIE